MHKKRKTIPNFWPLARTGTKYVSKATHDAKNSIPLMIALRDMLGIVKDRKELKKALHDKKIVINGKIVREENYPLSLCDSLSMPSINKHFRMWIKGKRFEMVEINENESTNRVYKIIGKKKLAGNKVQINLDSGRNIISNEKLETGNFLVIDNLKNKIEKIISVDKNVEVIAIKGKHMGKTGKIKEIVMEGEQKIALVKTKDEEIKANVNNLYIIK